MVETAGVELAYRIENRQVADSGNARIGTKFIIAKSTVTVQPLPRTPTTLKTHLRTAPT